MPTKKTIKGTLRKDSVIILKEIEIDTKVSWPVKKKKTKTGEIRNRNRLAAHALVTARPSSRSRADGPLSLTATLSAADVFGAGAVDSGAVYGAQVGASGVATAVLVVMASVAAGALG